ncbi:hypothetical protein CPB84DRAFT_1713077 [Gymnopilus junonius]|uniref:Uncharacterized protein n=1 Tax=Gymnopilus junonius TaxID=109634 RepID=A0A9P5NDR8_GYMJU|nr:hypothetical protein CPB84DRAFT_1713077 [Gymnopilus junonius]
MTGNKLRLYLGYWRRQESDVHPGKYHVSLLLTAKKPRNDLPTAKRYHAVNPIDCETKTEIWKFEILQTEARTTKLAGVMLLGKVPPDVTMEGIEEILKKVHVPTPEEAQKINWHCRHWVLEALEGLMVGGVILTPPSSPQEMWNTGRSFVEDKTARVDGYPVQSKWLYTCDMSGKEISSEIRPL